MATLKAGVIGSGVMAGMHTTSIRQLPGIEVARVWSRSADRAENLAKTVGARFGTSETEFLQDSDLDFYVLCVPTDLHADWLEKLAALGKPIFAEKPFVRTPQQADRILKVFAGYRQPVMIGHVLRYFWEYRLVRDLVKSGKLGTIGTIRLSRCSGFPQGRDGWYGDFSRAGGVILDLLLHDLDFLLWTWGQAERVFAQSRTVKSGTPQDYALVSIRMHSGEIVHLEGSWSEIPGTFYTTIEICGSKGIFEYDSRMNPQVTLSLRGSEEGKSGGAIVPEQPTLASPYLLEMQDFLASMTEGKAPLVGIGEGLEACRLAWAAIQSCEKGQAVNVHEK